MDTAAERNDGFAMAVVVEGGLGLGALVLAWVLNVSLREQFAPWGAPLAIAIVRGLAATVPMLIVFWWLVTSKLQGLRQLREQVEWLVREMFPTGSVLQFAMIATLAGVGEELLFRGTLQTKLGEWTSPVMGLCLTSFLFGLAHALSKLYFTFAVAVGVFLGWMTLEYHDLVAPMIAHGLYDFLALVYLSRTAARHDRAHNASVAAQSADEPQPQHDETNHR